METFLIRALQLIMSLSLLVIVLVRSRGLGDVYKRQPLRPSFQDTGRKVLFVLRPLVYPVQVQAEK